MTSNRNRPDAVNPGKNVPLRGIADRTKRVAAPTPSLPRQLAASGAEESV
jgi:hypothetical protein